MAKGQEAKEFVINKLQETFGNDWIGEFNKKYYVWSYEGGARTQVCISLTCPKVPVGAAPALDFSDNSLISTTPKESVSAEITQEERDKLEQLMKKLGL